MYRPIPRATRRKKKRYENTKNSKRVFVCARRSRSVERDRQTEKETERETEKEIDRQTDRQNRKREKETEGRVEAVRRRVERARGCVLAEGEFGRGETEREQRGGNETRGGRGRESISRLRTQPASLIHPRDVFSSSPLSSTTADDLARLYPESPTSRF